MTNIYPCFREGSQNLKSMVFDFRGGMGDRPNPYSELNKTFKLYKQHLVVMVCEEITVTGVPNLYQP